jgi:sugar lactone lactonase YvrE
VRVQIAGARDLAVDAAGNLYLADGVRARRVDSGGVLRTIAGDGYLTALGDGGPATGALLLRPSAVAFDASGTLYIADTGTGRVRRVRGGSINTLAGTLHAPMGVAVDPLGNVTVADTGNDRVVQIQAGAGLGVLVGAGLRGPRSVCFDGTGGFFIVDTLNHRVLRNGVEIRAEFSHPSACATDAAGNLFVADTGNDRVRKITAAGAATTVDMGALSAPGGVAVSPRGELFVSDSGNHRIRQVTPDGIVETHSGRWIRRMER